MLKLAAILQYTRPRPPGYYETMRPDGYRDPSTGMQSVGSEDRGLWNTL
jgi:hypothetical protein